MKQIFVVVNSKGGVGKTITSSMIIPIFFMGKEIKIYEIDDNNKTRIESKFLHFESLKVDDASGAISNIDFDTQFDTDGVSIIDAGGGNDTLGVLSAIKKSGLKNVSYLVPINDDIEQIYNLRNTITEIQKVDKKADIHLILNKSTSWEENDIKKQFVGIYGSDKYGIEPISPEVLAHIKSISVLPASPIFSILKNVYKTSLLDSYVMATDITNNLETYKKEWAAEGREFFKQKMTQVSFAYDVVLLVKEIFNAMDDLLEKNEK